MDEKILYLECYSGISGDMTVAALLDLGADQSVLLEGLNSLKVDGYKIEIGRTLKSSIDACDFNVIIGHSHDHDDHHHHDHDDHHHDHDHDHHHHHHDHHHHDHHHHDHDDHHHDHSNEIIHSSSPIHIKLGHHDHRNLFDINTIIDQSKITDHAKAIAKKIFRVIAEAEAKAHAKSLEDVHFHEVGAIDSIVDIVAAAICLDNLNITKVFVSELYEGTGQIKCQHGLLPIPVPAVINIASTHQLSLHITQVNGELVTPTGAAIVAAIKTEDALPKEMKVLKIGLGAGKRSYNGASGILRALLVQDASAEKKPTEDNVWLLEANIDDCPGEALAFTMDYLFENGAKDVYYTPIYMKKNRPAYMLSVICSEKMIERLEGIIFTNTTTIGIRRQEIQRTVLPREQRLVTTPYGDALVKACFYQDKTFIYPEYESLKVLCQKSGQDYLSMYHLVQELACNAILHTV